MSYKKMITLESAEWLPKLADYRKLLVRYSVVDQDDFNLGQDLPGAQRELTVSLSGTAYALWVYGDPRLLDDANLEKVLREFAFRKIKQKVESGDEPTIDQISITSHTNEKPASLGAIGIELGVPQEVTIERELGFYTSAKRHSNLS